MRDHAHHVHDDDLQQIGFGYVFSHIIFMVSVLYYLSTVDKLS